VLVQRTLVVALALFMTASAATAQAKLPDIRVGATGHLTQRNALFDGRLGRGSGSLVGAEAAVRTRLYGAGIRFFGGGVSADSGSEAVGDIGRGDIEGTLGPRSVSAQVGYALRSFTGAFGTRRWSFVRLGISSALPLGTTGLVASASASVYLGVSGSYDSGGGGGREAETRLTYTPHAIPVYVALGYRIERFTVEDPLEQRPEELSGILLAVGVRLDQLTGRR
jgi:hypothetical protein